MPELIISAISALVALGSFWFTHREWQRINKKIAMLTDSGLASEILPTWYTSRMMTDEWYFGIQTTDGSLIVISRICAVSDDGKWLDVNLLTRDEIPSGIKHANVLSAVAEDRREASIQIEKIVAAYEIASS